MRPETATAEVAAARPRQRFELGENALMALETLRTHKTRSLLTVLGVVIGIVALIGVASIMVGMDRQVRDFLNDYGTQTLFIFKWNPGIHPGGRLSEEERTRKPLTYDDASAIAAECPAVKAVAAATGTTRPSTSSTPGPHPPTRRCTTRTSSRGGFSPRQRTCTAPTWW